MEVDLKALFRRFKAENAAQLTTIGLPTELYGLLFHKLLNGIDDAVRLTRTFGGAPCNQGNLRLVQVVKLTLVRRSVDDADDTFAVRMRSCGPQAQAPLAAYAPHSRRQYIERCLFRAPFPP